MTGRVVSLMFVIGLGVGACASPKSIDAGAETETEDDARCGPDASASLSVGACAPDFSMPDRDGVAHTLYAQRGKVALVDISAIW